VPPSDLGSFPIVHDLSLSLENRERRGEREKKARRIVQCAGRDLVKENTTYEYQPSIAPPGLRPFIFWRPGYFSPNLEREHTTRHGRQGRVGESDERKTDECGD